LQTVMSVHISDSAIYRNSWDTPELRDLFDDAALTAGWIEVMVALAETEAEFGLIPAAAVRQIADTCRTVALDEAFFAEVRQDFERTNHSLLGLIRGLQRRCPGDSGEWICYGATVQDITDTHTARILVKMRNIFADQLMSVATVLFDLARRYRNTPMCGRTHGQPGLSITFGFKAAGWLDEIQRHCQRLDEVGIGYDADQLVSLFVFDDSDWTDILLLHQLRRSCYRVVRQAINRVLRHHFITLLHMVASLYRRRPRRLNILPSSPPRF
jgi:hypothetical protein